MYSPRLADQELTESSGGLGRRAHRRAACLRQDRNSPAAGSQRSPAGHRRQRKADDGCRARLGPGRPDAPAHRRVAGRIGDLESRPAGRGRPQRSRPVHPDRIVGSCRRHHPPYRSGAHLPATAADHEFVRDGGVGQIDAAAATLLKFRERINVEAVGEPKSLGVIVSTGYGYRRSDGVCVIPIGALGP